MEAYRTSSQTATLAVYERWDEVYVSSDKGKREVHYYLKRRNGDGLDLAVVGKEKTPRHMTYHYAFKDREQRFLLPKLRSRREVIDWLNTVVNPELQPHQSVKSGTYMANRDANSQDSHVAKKMNQFSKEFTWLGSPWTCRKRRRHYQSFYRNGVEIAVHDFVYVLAEEDERLVAHLDDMYEDIKGNKMVVVRWFHRIDEVGIGLPQSCSDREIFFSLCLQDLSIECIDGLATVLSPQHYELFLNGAKHTQLEPFVCHRQFDNDEIKPFDITQLKGYWKQDLLKYMSSCSSLKHHPVDDSLEVERNFSDSAGNRPKKRLRWSEGCDTKLQSTSRKVDTDATLQSSKVVKRLCRLKELSTASFGNIALEQKNSQHLSIGSQVEVLSQDSGIRGCWFRAFIVKKHKEKVKVRYQDIRDATNEAQNLEEWVLASRSAAPDELGIRICGRSIVRPIPWTNKGKVSWVFNVGTLVDVWRHDGWWEGIVVNKESEDRLRVYFPGERQELIFGCGDLRHSQEWLEDGWKQLKERSDLVSVLSGLEIKQDIANSGDIKPEKAVSCCDGDLMDNCVVDMVGDEKLNESKVVRDLSKDDLLSQLRWKSSGRRRHGRSPVHKLHFAVDDDNRRAEDSHKLTHQKYFGLSSLKVDPDKCKYWGDSPFDSSIVSPLSNLVMTR